MTMEEVNRQPSKEAPSSSRFTPVWGDGCGSLTSMYLPAYASARRLRASDSTQIDFVSGLQWDRYYPIYTFCPDCILCCNPNAKDK